MMKCFNCELGILKRRETEVTSPFRGGEYTVSTPALVCDRCAYVAFDPKDGQEHMRRVADAYRKDHNLLTSGEIQSRRKALRMTQREFAKYLSVGEASIKRWELGAVQDEAHDRYIRLKTDPAEADQNAHEVAFRLL
jgi:putative zinc finger/helix-turn-helix YgiT family protein